MDYKKFLKECKFTKDDRTKYNVIKKHIKTDYVNYEAKITICQNIVKLTSEKMIDDRKVYFKNTPGQYIMFILKLIENYTDIEYDPEETFDIYNEFNKNGILELLFAPFSDSEDSLIPQKEYQEFKTVLNMCNDDYYENYRSLGSIIESKIEATNMTINAISEAFKEVAENGESISVLQS